MNVKRATRMAAVGVVALVFAPPATGADKPIRVMDVQDRIAGTRSISGVVGKVDADRVILVEFVSEAEVREHDLVFVDLLRKGEVLDGVRGMSAYTAKDLKPGDVIDVQALKDKADGVDYCLEIGIRRRPGAKLPQSQKPKECVEQYATDSIFNDLENGEDVADEDIKTAFPPKKNARGVLQPGGLPADYQKKLDAIRAKKAKDRDEKKPDLKAPTPADKK